MAIVKYSPSELLAALPEGRPVPEPIGEPVSKVSVNSFISGTAAGTRTGVWECTPGQWRRQIVQAEFCLFLEGDCTFTPDQGEAIEITGGEAVYFPAGSLGVWTVRETARKVYVIFEEPR